jgi:hypothetical protein
VVPDRYQFTGHGHAAVPEGLFVRGAEKLTPSSGSLQHGRCPRWSIQGRIELARLVAAATGHDLKEELQHDRRL